VYLIRVDAAGFPHNDIVLNPLVVAAVVANAVAAGIAAVISVGIVGTGIRGRIIGLRFRGTVHNLGTGRRRFVGEVLNPVFVDPLINFTGYKTRSHAKNKKECPDTNLNLYVLPFHWERMGFIGSTTSTDLDREPAIDPHPCQRYFPCGSLLILISPSTIYRKVFSAH
jgi:hypothetical protein